MLPLKSTERILSQLRFKVPSASSDERLQNSTTPSDFPIARVLVVLSNATELTLIASFGVPIVSTQ